MTQLAQFITRPPIGQEARQPVTAAEVDALWTVRPDPPIRGAYVHMPFCFHKCHYCDFYSIVDSRDRMEQFARRLASELDACGHRFERPLRTIFIGGGTPTLLPARLWRDIVLPAIHRCLPLESGGEFTVEANPETITVELAETLVAGGVNRVSIGAQSFHPHHLKTLERWHDPANVGRSVGILRDAGLTNINLDLIFAIPGQTLPDWLDDLEQALALGPQHLSCYGLTYEPNTPMTARLKAGRFARVDEDLEAGMFEATIDRLMQAGFEHYEISNFARPRHRCRHNLLYWANEPWWAFGPSASGHVNGVRWKNIARLGKYLDHGPLPPIGDVERLAPEAAVGEALMLRLRLREGMPEAELNALLAGDERRRIAMARHLQAGLLEHAGAMVRLSRRGLLLADCVFSDLV